jgi:hypothetical protein
LSLSDGGVGLKSRLTLSSAQALATILVASPGVANFVARRRDFLESFFD